jgi:hypothetical protein
MKTREFNWADEVQWPFAGPDYVFAAGALNVVGRELFPDWTGDELNSCYKTGRQLRSLSESLPEQVNRRFDAKWLLKKFKSKDVPAEEFTEQDWQEARDAYADYEQAGRDARTRIAQAAIAVRNRAAAGNLVGAIKHNDGHFGDFAKERWQRENSLDWITSGEVVCGDVFPSALGNNRDTHHLFFRRDSLVLSLDRSQQSLGYLSPYMRLMLDVVQACAISVESQSKIDDVIQPFIDAEWEKRGLPESEKLRTAMATMVREPSAQAGRAKRKTEVRG